MRIHEGIYLYIHTCSVAYIYIYVDKYSHARCFELKDSCSIVRMISGLPWMLWSLIAVINGFLWMLRSLIATFFSWLNMISSPFASSPLGCCGHCSQRPSSQLKTMSSSSASSPPIRPSLLYMSGCFGGRAYGYKTTNTCCIRGLR